MKTTDENILKSETSDVLKINVIKNNVNKFFINGHRIVCPQTNEIQVYMLETKSAL